MHKTLDAYLLICQRMGVIVVLITIFMWLIAPFISKLTWIICLFTGEGK
jgi:hypothetical protein